MVYVQRLRLKPSLVVVPILEGPIRPQTRTRCHFPIFLVVSLLGPETGWCEGGPKVLLVLDIKGGEVVCYRDTVNVTAPLSLWWISMFGPRNEKNTVNLLPLGRSASCI